MKIDTYKNRFIQITENEFKSIVDNEKDTIKYFETANRYFRSTKFVDMTTESDRMINRTVVMVTHQECLNPKSGPDDREYGEVVFFLNPKFIYMLEAIRHEEIRSC